MANKAGSIFESAEATVTAVGKAVEADGAGQVDVLAELLELGVTIGTRDRCNRQGGRSYPVAGRRPPEHVARLPV